MRLLLAGLLLIALPARSEELLLFAASSTTDVVDALAREYQARTGDVVRPAYGPSPSLARQIEDGAPADLFLSADVASMDRVEEAGLVTPRDRHLLLGNRLVVVMRRDGGFPITGPEGLLALRRLALADPDGVSEGLYARAWLTAAGVWARLKDRVLPTLDSRSAVGAVATGLADAAVVYQSDVVASPAVKAVYRVPLEKTPPIRYCLGRLAHGRGRAAEGFLRFLQSDRARALFARAGFSMLGGR